MKKKLCSLWCCVFAACALSLLLLSCGGGGGGGSDDYEAPVAESGSTTTSVSSAITGSEVFIDGRTVTIWATWCCDHEVTQGEYEQYCTYGESQPSSTNGLGSNYPVYGAHWYDALVYCNRRSIGEHLMPCYTINSSTNPDDWGSVPSSSDDATWNGAICDFSANGYRLPTEAEWEFFARGGNLTNSGQTTYSGSDNIDSVAWYDSNSSFTHHEVKKKLGNSLHLYDMSGNAWEWCWDWYGSISESTPSSGASSGSQRVFRGGGCFELSDYCSVAFRDGNGPGGGCGFRVVRTAN